MRPLLKKLGVRRAVIVTSRFHTRRALATFQRRIPEVGFGVVGCKISWWNTPKGKKGEDEFARIECGKMLAYWVIHKIPPFPKKAPAE